MSETSGYKVGSDEWFSFHADKLLAGALDIVKYKLIGVGKTGDASNTDATGSTFNNALTNKLPFILGGIAVVGIVVILLKRA